MPLHLEEKAYLHKAGYCTQSTFVDLTRQIAAFLVLPGGRSNATILKHDYGHLCLCADHFPSTLPTAKIELKLLNISRDDPDNS